MTTSNPQAASSTPTRKVGPLLEVRDVVTHFPRRPGSRRRDAGSLRAVNGVSLTLSAGETLGLVGESGCGKSTLARSILRLTPVTSGSVRFAGNDLLSLPPRRLRSVRAGIQVILQDSAGSLNPRMTVEQIVAEPLLVHRVASGGTVENRVVELLARVGLPPDAGLRYPHELSGGQRQRIGIARAIALEPALIICDEPVSALDVSVQAQILNLLLDLQAELGMAYLFISHDLSVVQRVSDRVAVMYMGKIVETGPTVEVCRLPAHPYTQALLRAVPQPDPGQRSGRLSGDDPAGGAVIVAPGGCAYAVRCPGVTECCRDLVPPLESKLGLAPGRMAACHHVGNAGAD